MYDWTDPSLGNCSYLDTCRNMRNCKYIHYELDTAPDNPAAAGPLAMVPGNKPHAVPRWGPTVIPGPLSGWGTMITYAQ